MNAESAKYALKNGLGGMNNEYIEVTVSNDPLAPATGEEMLKEAKRIVLTGVTRVGAERPAGNPPAPRTNYSQPPTPQAQQRTAPNGGYQQRANGGGYNNAPRQYAPTDWDSFPIRINTSTVRMKGPEFAAFRQFMKDMRFKFNSENKTWYGSEPVAFPASLQFLNDCVTDLNAGADPAGAYDNDQVNTEWT